MVLRLNDAGSTPADNPLHQLGAQTGQGIGGAVGAEVGANLQRVFAHGVRNSSGMAFDPTKGDLWKSENGGRAFDNINRIKRGHNGGWAQVMGPFGRNHECKAIEVAVGVGANGPDGALYLVCQTATGKIYRIVKP